MSKRQILNVRQHGLSKSSIRFKQGRHVNLYLGDNLYRRAFNFRRGLRVYRREGVYKQGINMELEWIELTIKLFPSGFSSCSE